MIVAFDNKYPEYAAPSERPVIQRLVDLCLRDDQQVSIWDGEELSVIGCSNKLHILKHLAMTDADQLEVYNRAGHCLGWFHLIYNNDSGSGPLSVISDFSPNEWTDKVYNNLHYDLWEPKL